ncbi:MAG: acetyl-CoA carboxylase carboxyltransferase subunit beta, partial [Planctomycetota bacterium]
PLNFRAKKAYRDKLKAAVKASGIKDCAVVGEGRLHGVDVVFAVIDPNFIMGAMGSVTGEKIARGAELAREKRCPYIVISGSGGGARMEEGVLSLMQMAKTSAAIGRLQRDGGLYIVVLTNATMGGSMASFASLGDVIVAEPMALLGFTGPRVIQQTIKKEMPEGFQKSEFLLKHGFIDRIVERRELKDYLGWLVRFFTNAEPLKREGREKSGDGKSASQSGRIPAVGLVDELVMQNAPMPVEREIELGDTRKFLAQAPPDSIINPGPVHADGEAGASGRNGSAAVSGRNGSSASADAGANGKSADSSTTKGGDTSVEQAAVSRSGE